MNLRIGLDMDIGREFAVKLQHLMVGAFGIANLNMAGRWKDESVRRGEQDKLFKSPKHSADRKYHGV